MSRIKTPLYSQILDLLTREHLLTVPQLVTLLDQGGNRYNKTSVYRALEKLVADDKLCKLNFGTNDIVYELRDAHHDHVVCNHCGAVQAVACIDIPAPDAGSFKLDHHHLTYFGTCAKCQAMAA